MRITPPYVLEALLIFVRQHDHVVTAVPIDVEYIAGQGVMAIGQTHLVRVFPR